MILTMVVACLVAGISTAAFVILWFRVVYQELYKKQKSAEAARGQLIASKQSYMRAKNEPEKNQAREIAERSKHIYNQSVQLYNEALHMPWNRIPGKFMGFRTIVNYAEQ